MRQCHPWCVQRVCACACGGRARCGCGERASGVAVGEGERSESRSRIEWVPCWLDGARVCRRRGRSARGCGRNAGEEGAGGGRTWSVMPCGETSLSESVGESEGQERMRKERVDEGKEGEERRGGRGRAGAGRVWSESLALSSPSHARLPPSLHPPCTRCTLPASLYRLATMERQQACVPSPLPPLPRPATPPRASLNMAAVFPRAQHR